MLWVLTNREEFVKKIRINLVRIHILVRRWKSEKGRKLLPMEILTRYVVILVLSICLCLGYIIKHSIPFIPNKYIPLIMAIVGIILNVWINGWKITPEILLGGLASGLASTGAFEMVRNIKQNTEEGNVNTNLKNK